MKKIKKHKNLKDSIQAKFSENNLTITRLRASFAVLLFILSVLIFASGVSASWFIYDKALNTVLSEGQACTNYKMPYGLFKGVCEKALYD